MSVETVAGPRRILLLPVLAVLVAVLFWAFGAGAGTAQAQAAPRLNYNQVLMAKGQGTTIKVTGAKGKVRWTSSKKGTVGVSSRDKATAKLKAKKTGSATVTAKVGRKTLKVSVKAVKTSGRTLIAYMSWSGTTKAAAQKIQKLTGADIVRIKPRTAYTSNYDRLTQVAQREQRQNARPALGTKVANAKQYRTVILGYPIWWGTEPMLIRSFLTQTNVSGKAIVPFSTSMGSGFSGSRAGIVRSAKGATVKTGRDLTDASNPAIASWLSAQGVAVKGTAGTSAGSQGSQQQQGGSTSRDGDSGSMQPGTTPTDPEQTRDQQTRTGSGKALVVYWSGSGNTQRVAGYIANHLNIPSYELQLAQPYTSDDLNWTNSNSRVVSEHESAASPAESSVRPALVGTVPNWNDYDTVYLGYPLWWQQAPHLLYTFVENTSFAGKMVIPFCTSLSSPVGTSATNLAQAARAHGNGGNWLVGQRFSGGATEQQVVSWVDSLK